MIFVIDKALKCILWAYQKQLNQVREKIIGNKLIPNEIENLEPICKVRFSYVFWGIKMFIEFSIWQRFIITKSEYSSIWIMYHSITMKRTMTFQIKLQFELWFDLSKIWMYWSWTRISESRTLGIRLYFRVKVEKTYQKFVKKNILK